MRRQEQIARLDQIADKVAKLFEQLYRTTDLLYAASAQLRQASALLKGQKESDAADRLARRRASRGRRPGQHRRAS